MSSSLVCLLLSRPCVCYLLVLFCSLTASADITASSFAARLCTGRKFVCLLQWGQSVKKVGIFREPCSFHPISPSLCLSSSSSSPPPLSLSLCLCLFLVLATFSSGEFGCTNYIVKSRFHFRAKLNEKAHSAIPSIVFSREISCSYIMWYIHLFTARQ